MVKITVQMVQLPIISGSRNRAGMMTPAQLRAARALVGWSRDDLANHSGVGAGTIKDFEKINGSDPKQGTVQKWQRALEAAGVVFTDEDDMMGPGVRLKESSRKQEGKKRR